MSEGINRGVLSSVERTHLNHPSSSWPEISGYSRVDVMGESLHMESTETAEVRKDFLDLTALVRSIQYAEGLADCFRQLQGSCDQWDCTWRKYCWMSGENSFLGGVQHRWEAWVSVTYPGIKLDRALDST